MSNYEPKGFEGRVGNMMEIRDLEEDGWRNWKRLSEELPKAEKLFKDTKMSEEKLRRLNKRMAELLADLNSSRN